jgi:hypothetical protein
MIVDIRWKRKVNHLSTRTLINVSLLNPFICFPLPLSFFSSLLSHSLFFSQSLLFSFHVSLSPTLTSLPCNIFPYLSRKNKNKNKNKNKKKLTSLIFFLSTSIFFFLRFLTLTKIKYIGLKIQLGDNYSS